MNLGAVAAGVVIVLALAAACGGRRDAAILDAVEMDDGTLVFWIDACNADDNRVEVDETPESIVVAVTTDDDPDDGDDCSDSVMVRLAAPLEDRPVIDGSTNEPVQVRAFP